MEKLKNNIEPLKHDVKDLENRIYCLERSRERLKIDPFEINSLEVIDPLGI